VSSPVVGNDSMAVPDKSLKRFKINQKALNCEWFDLLQLPNARNPLKRKFVQLFKIRVSLQAPEKFSKLIIHIVINPMNSQFANFRPTESCSVNVRQDVVVKDPENLFKSLNNSW
jgi:hypothetical protein